jgi:hypothetical protein
VYNYGNRSVIVNCIYTIVIHAFYNLLFLDFDCCGTVIYFLLEQNYKFFSCFFVVRWYYFYGVEVLYCFVAAL